MLSPALGGRGFSLVEVVLAMGIFVCAFLAIVGLVPLGMHSSRDAVQFTSASQIANAIDCDLRASAERTNGTSAIYKIPLQVGTNVFYLDSFGNYSGDANSAPPASGQYRATIGIVQAGGTFAINKSVAPVTSVSILLTWPATAPLTNASRLEVASSFTWPH